jgi:hypothetical protein
LKDNRADKTDTNPPNDNDIVLQRRKRHEYYSTYLSSRADEYWNARRGLARRSIANSCVEHFLSQQKRIFVKSASGTIELLTKVAAGAKVIEYSGNLRKSANKNK